MTADVAGQLAVTVTVREGFVFGWRHQSDLVVEPAVVPLVEVFEDGVLELLVGAPWAAAVDHFAP